MKKYLSVLFVVMLSISAFALGSAPKLPGVNDLKQQVVTELMSLDSDIAGVAQQLAILLPTGGDIRPLLRKIYDEHSSVADIAVIDPAGIIRIIEPAAYKSAEGKPVNGMDQLDIMKETKSPLLSEQFMAVEGFSACSLAYPIYSTGGKLFGYISVVFKPDALLKKIIDQYATINPTVEVTMIQLDGRIIYDKDILQVGQMTFTSPNYKNYPALLTLANRMTAEATGQGVYEYLPQYGTTPVKKEADWSTITLHGREWRLVVSKIIS
ncbi:MAG: PDC sensor domain-containing protein [Candidatus Margulisiibacteriota bacterium]